MHRDKKIKKLVWAIDISDRKSYDVERLEDSNQSFSMKVSRL